MISEKSKSIRRRAAMVLLILGALLLCVDIGIRTGIAYPDYVFAENGADQTQRMIIEDVVGTRLTIDLGSELFGYLCLFASLLVVLTYAKPEVSMQKEIKKLASKFGWLMPRVNIRYIAIPAAGALLYVAARLLPFVTNGLYRYGSEYFINFGLVLVEAAALLFSTLCFLRECDRFQNHKETQFIYLFLILSVISGILRGFAAFYGLNGVYVAYMIINTVTTVVMCITIIHYVRTEEIVEAQAANASAEDFFAEAPAGEPEKSGESPIFFKN